MTHTLALPSTGLRYTTSAGTDLQRAPVLLLHPWFGCCAFWDRTAEDSAAPTYAVDWYSLGEGDWSSWSGPEALTDATVALLDAVDAQQVDVVGNSVGGIVAQLLAARHPDRIRRLVLVGTGASLDGPPSRFAELVAVWVEGVADRAALAPAMVDALTAGQLPDAERGSYVRAVLEADPDFLSAVLVSARDLDLRSELTRITAATLVIRGEHDTARGHGHVVDLLDGIPNARAVEMTGCGHSPMVEQPRLFNDLVEDHLTPLTTDIRIDKEETGMWAQKLVRPGVFEQMDVSAPDADSLRPGETMLRVEAGAICGSDLPYFRGETCIHFDDAAPLAANTPGFPLHEVVGEVVASDDPALPVGSRAVGWATRFSALAEFTVTDSDSLMAVPDELDSATALTLQPLACVLETVRSLGPVDGLRVGVLGLGPFGLLFCHALSAAGAAQVVGVDRLDRSAIADAFGIDTFVHSATGRWARSLTDDERPDLVIEAVGHQTATLTDAVEAVAQDGRIFCFGVPDEPVYPLPMQELFRKHVTLSGGIVAERRRCLESALTHQRRFPELQKQLVSHTFDFTDAQLAFELASRPASGRLKVQLVR